MPTAPTLGQQVAPRAAPDIRLNPTVPTAAVPGAVDTIPDLGGAVREVGSMAQQAEAARAQADQVAVSDADAQLVRAKTKRLWDPESGAMNARGKDAIPVSDAAQAGFQTDAAEIEGSLSNDRQKAAFRRRVDMHYADLGGQLGQHVASQITQYDRDTTNGHLQALADSATASYQDAPSVERAIHDTRAVMTDYWRRNGHGAGPDGIDDFAQRHVADRVSAIRAAVFDQYSSSGQDLAAAAYFDAHKDEFTGHDREIAEKVAKAGSSRAQAQAETQRILSGGTTDTPRGLLTPGTLDLSHRPRVTNPDGSISTVRSMSFEEDGKEILVPTVTPDGKNLTESQAIARYHATGEHLGIFATAADATKYATQLHEAQAAQLAGVGDGRVRRQSAPPTLADAIAEAEKIPEPTVQDDVVRRIRQHFADRASDLLHTRQQTYQAASAILEKSGGDMDAVPLKMRSILLPGENEALQHRADQIRHPKDYGDTESFYHLKNLAHISDESRGQFAQENIATGYPKLSDAQRSELLTLQRSVRTQTAHATTKAGAHASAPTIAATPVAPDRPANPLAGLLTPTTPPGTPLRKPSPAMLVDVAKKGEGYATYLRSMGYNIPASAHE